MRRLTTTTSKVRRVTIERNPTWLSERDDSILIDVLVVPRAARDRVLGVHDNRLKIQVSAPPVDGQANMALVRFLAKAVGVSKAQIHIVGGATSRRKTVALSGVGAKRVLFALG